MFQLYSYQFASQNRCLLWIVVLSVAFSSQCLANTFEVVHFRSVEIKPLIASSQTQENSSDSEKGFPIWGYLSKPQDSGSFPAIVLMHGCNGIHQSHFDWASTLNKLGYVTLIVDSFRPRSTLGVCDKYLWSTSPPQRALDAYGSLSFLKTLSVVDIERVGILGWSHGGVSTLHAINRSGMSVKFEQKFSAATVFYPYCITDRSFDLPVLILIGKADDWTPPGLCEELYLRNKNSENGDLLQLVVYPGAHHAFDVVQLKTAYLLEDASGKKHVLKYNQKAHEDSVQRVKHFFANNL